MNLDQTTVRHYEHGSLEKALLAAVTTTGRNADGTLAHTDISAFDEFHIGGRQATAEFSGQIDLPRGAHVLDVGSGLGGPSRYFAAERGWKIDGIDLTPEYVEVAGQGLAKGRPRRCRDLSRRQRRQPALRRRHFRRRLYAACRDEHSRQEAVFAEVHHVLKTDGLFAIYDIFRESDGAFSYPVPWSSAPETNFIDTIASYRRLLNEAGFKIDKERNRRDFALASFQQMRQRAAEGAPPTQIAMGSTAGQKSANLAKLVAEGVVAPVELVSRAA